MLAVFQSVEEVGEHWVGALRPGLLCLLAMGHDALYLHAGGSPGPMPPSRTGAAAFDCVNGPYEGTLFWRDKERRKSMGMEHSVLTSGPTITELMPTYSYRLEHKEGYQYPVSFLAEGRRPRARRGTGSAWSSPPIRPGCSPISRRPDFIWWREYGAPYLDGNTGEQVAVKMYWSCVPMSPISRG